MSGNRRNQVERGPEILGETEEQRREKLNTEIEKLNTAIEEQDRRLNYLQSSAFQLGNYYFVFQGVILTVIGHSSSALRCEDRWIPFVLSLVAVILNLASLLVIGVEYLRILDQRDIFSKKLDETNRDLQRLPRTTDQNHQIPRGTRDAFKTCKRAVSFVLCMVLFLVFAIIMLVACWTIICRREANGKHLPNINGKCVRLCDGSNCISICGED